MIDHIRHDIEQRLNALLAEADKLRKALAALGTRAASRNTRQPRRPAGTQVRPASVKSATTPRGRDRSTAGAAAPSRTRNTAQKRQTKPVGESEVRAQRQSRGGSGSTRAAVLAALGGGEAMTATAVAEATGLARGTVSTTLSRLAKAGEITKAPRGYRLAQRSQPETQ